MRLNFGHFITNRLTWTLPYIVFTAVEVGYNLNSSNIFDYFVYSYIIQIHHVHVCLYQTAVTYGLQLNNNAL